MKEETTGQKTSNTEAPIVSNVTSEVSDSFEVPPAIIEDVAENRTVTDIDRLAAASFVGIIFSTFIILQNEDVCFIVDQHAAHEKIYYEQFVTQLGSKEPSSQQLYPPVMTSLTLEEEAFYLQEEQLFEKAGFEVEHYGGREYCIRAVPQNLYGFKEEELFQYCIFFSE